MIGVDAIEKPSLFTDIVIEDSFLTFVVGLPLAFGDFDVKVHVDGAVCQRYYNGFENGRHHYRCILPLDAATPDAKIFIVKVTSGTFDAPLFVQGSLKSFRAAGFWRREDYIQQGQGHQLSSDLERDRLP